MVNGTADGQAMHKILQLHSNLKSDDVHSSGVRQWDTESVKRAEKSLCCILLLEAWIWQGLMSSRARQQFWCEVGMLNSYAWGSCNTTVVSLCTDS